MNIWKARLVLVAIAAVAALDPQVVAQSRISGDIAGTVTDPSGAVIPNVSIALRSLDTGAAQTTSANQVGQYRFTLLKPGHYVITGRMDGFQNVQRAVDVSVGQVAAVDLQLEVGQATQTVEVTSAIPLVSTDAATVTGFSQSQVEMLPSAGGDITNIAFTAPGAVVNLTTSYGGYGNFTVNGLPATSNLFTINGENNMDPYFNINNSGATNLTLGQNEIQEVSIISNPYGGEYGQLAGAQVTYVTRSGTNDFHGNALYSWNGRALNANNWLNNATGTPRPFSNSNQWASSLGGPVLKNRTFFFVDAEGLRFVLPNVLTTRIPTADFAGAVLKNVQAQQPNEFSTYQNLFKLWQNAPGAAAAQALPNSAACNALNLPGFDPATQACTAQFFATPTALASEWILGGRVDQRLGDKDDAYFRYKMDRGVQPTYLSAVSPDFNAISHQPSWDTQLKETHIFGPRAANEFMATLSYYDTLFQQDHAKAAAAFPYGVITSGTVTFGQDIGGGVFDTNPMRMYPQGRNITQYQFIDNFTLNRGSHNLKFGVNFRRYDVSDHNFVWNYPAAYFGYVTDGLQRFADGRAYQYRQALNASSNVPVAMWGTGLYAHDEWKISPKLSLTFALRAEHNSNPVCQQNCFANFKTDWSKLASVTSADPGSVPYSSDIAFNQHQAYQGVDAINWSPRIGFSWAPRRNNKTVVSGGFGIFYDNPAAGLVDNLLTNPPSSVMFRVRPSSGVLPFDPAGGANTFAASAAAFDVNKTYSQMASELSALGVVFAPPAFTGIIGTVHSPQWRQWNLQVQHELSSSVVVNLGYSGNSGINIPYSNAWYNAFDQYGYFPGVAGVPSAPAVPNYGTVSLTRSGAISNYNGLTASLKTRFSHGFSAHFNYTWSHNLDEASNGGLFSYGDSLFGQFNPASLRAGNYGNSDYDVRHLVSADFVYNPSFHFSRRVLNSAAGGWELAGKVFWHTGLPFSIVDGNAALGNGGGAILAQYIGGQVQPTSCGKSANYTGTGTCLNANAFIDSAAASFTGYSAWSSQTRNQFRGPHYFDTDMSLFKTFKMGERVSFGAGAQAFNLFNHPNFYLPDNTLGSPTFGQIFALTSTPTSPYGNFLKFDASPRVVQISGRLRF